MAPRSALCAKPRSTFSCRFAPETIFCVTRGHVYSKLAPLNQRLQSAATPSSSRPTPLMRPRGAHVLLFLMATCTRLATAATVHVAPMGGQDTTHCGNVSNPCASLQYAVSNRTVSGDTVVAMSGVHRGPFSPRGKVGDGIELSGRDITVTGLGRAVVDCQGSGRGFHIKESGRHDPGTPTL